MSYREELRRETRAKASSVLPMHQAVLDVWFTQAGEEPALGWNTDSDGFRRWAARLPSDWIESVWDEKIAVPAGYFVLRAVPAAPAHTPLGCDASRIVTVAAYGEICRPGVGNVYRGSGEIELMTKFMVSYAGEHTVCDHPAVGMERLLRLFERALGLGLWNRGVK